MTHSLIRLDPDDLSGTLQRLAADLAPAPDTLDVLRRIIALFPHDGLLLFDETQADLYRQLALADKFTFDLDTDTLLIFSDDADTLIDALIEMAMYLSGFATMMGNDDAWVTEFAAGAWKPVKNRIKRQLDLPVSSKPRGVVGLPPAPTTARRSPTRTRSARWCPSTTGDRSSRWCCWRPAMRSPSISHPKRTRKCWPRMSTCAAPCRRSPREWTSTPARSSTSG